MLSSLLVAATAYHAHPTHHRHATLDATIQATSMAVDELLEHNPEFERRAQVQEEAAIRATLKAHWADATPNKATGIGYVQTAMTAMYALLDGYKNLITETDKTGKPCSGARPVECGNGFRRLACEGFASVSEKGTLSRGYCAQWRTPGPPSYPSCPLRAQRRGQRMAAAGTSGVSVCRG